MKNQFFSKSQKKLFQSNCFNRPRFVDLFRSVRMIKVIKFPYLEKRRKKTPFWLIFPKKMTKKLGDGPEKKKILKTK